MRTIDEALSSKICGLHYGNRLILPFNCEILKIIIENDIISDFSSKKKGAEFTSRKNFTEIYFYDYHSLREDISEYENIKLVVVDDDKDIFNRKNHRRIIVHIKEKHVALVEEATDDILFIE